ncbi:MAG: Phenylacetic acid catabolic protein [Ilumatobacteraceae bacterium]
MKQQDIALALADDLFVQCQTLSPWTTNYVDLEESLAVGSIAQEILAHSGVLMQWAGLDQDQKDRRIFARSASDWKVSELSFLSAGSWPELICSAYFLTQASKVIVNALMAGSDEDRKGLQLVHSEQLLHLSHWRRWIIVLLADADTKSDVTTALRMVLDRTGDILADSTSVIGTFRKSWLADVKADFEQWGISLDPAVVAEKARITGGSNVEKLVADLGFARAADGSPEYSVY